MKRFISLILIFLAPIISILILLELYACLPKTTFNQKANYIENNKDIELLILGSSHNQKAFNPNNFTTKAANLAFGFQDYGLDSSLFNKYINNLKTLKFVVLEVDYHSLEYTNNESYYRYAWYYYYYNINITQLPLYYKYILYISSPDYFNKTIKTQKLNIFNNQINKYGYSLNNNITSDYFYKLNYEDLNILKQAKKRFEKKHISKVSIENYKKNSIIIEGIIKTCLDNNVTPILISTPLHHSFIKLKNKNKDYRRRSLIDKLIKKYPSIIYLNFENNKQFLTSDFTDEDHLNYSGAEKITLILDKKINSLKNK